MARHIVAAAASIKKETESMLPFISVIVPIYNEQDFIGETLEQIASQDYPPERYEVLVVDGMSSDQTRNIVTSKANLFQNFRMLDNPEKISSAARNVGFKNSRGDYIIIIDGHVYIENKSLFHDMVEIFNETGLEVLSRPQPLTPPGNNYFQNAVAFARESFIGHGIDSTIYDKEFTGPVDPSSSGAMYKRSIINTVGYFDESFDAAEDYEYNFRISQHNKQSYISPLLAVYYYPRNKLGELFRQMCRYGLGRNKMLRKYGEILRSGTLIPPLFFLSILAFIPLSFAVEELWLLPIMMGSAYFITLIIASITVACCRGMKYLPVLPCIYITIHLGLAFGMISGFLSSGDSSNSSKN